MPRPFPPAVISAAQACEIATRIPASVTLAQWAIESAWGERVTGTNNYFGIKAKKGSLPKDYTMCATHETIGGRSVPCMQPFQNYDTMASGFMAHAALLASGSPYADARKVLMPGWQDPAHVRAFVDAFGEVYATARDYDKTIISEMNARNLYQYDQFAVRGGKA